MTEALKYKLLYIVAEEAGLSSKGLSGALELHEDHVSITGPEQVRLAYSDFEELRIFRQHKVGTLIHVRCPQTSVFFAVPRFNLFGVFAVIDYLKTRTLFDELQCRANSRG